MASEEQNNRQQQFNDFLEREIELRAENQRFLGETLSISSQLQDQINFQFEKFSQILTLDKEILKASRDNINIVKRLSDSYQSINDIQKDQQKIQKQISSNLTVIAAKSKDLNEQDLRAARAYVDREKAINSSTEAISGMISEQEKMEAQFQAQEDAGRALTEEQIGQRIGLQAKLDAERFLTSEKIRQQEEAKNSLNNEALSVELLRDQNKELERGAEYLTKEENKLLAIVRAQGLWNSSLGAVEGILKKAGAGGAAIALGLERGRIEAEAMAKKLTDFGNDQDLGFIQNIGIELKVLGAGIKGTFMGMADSLKAISFGAILVGAFKKAFKLLGGPIVTGFISDLKSKFTEGVSYLKDQFFSLNSYIEDAKAGESFLQFMSQQTADIATNLGIGTAESAKLITQAKGLSRELGMLPEELAKTTAELNIAFGTTQKFSDDTVKTMGQLTHQFGLTNDEASEFVKLSKLSGKETSDFTLETKTRVQSLKEASNIAISEKAVMQEIAKSSAAIQLSSKGQGKNLADAAFHAKKLGLSLAQTEAIGGSLLDFESSIANEMEAELLIGRDLNLDKARQFALNNDIAGVAKEIAGQIGSAAEFGKMNVLQQEALAKSVGVSRDELANMLKTQELLAGTGFDEMSEAQDQFKNLVKETGSEEAALAKMRANGASEALTDQIRVVSLQEKRTQQERDILDAQASLAKNVNAMFTAFNKVTKVVKDLKTTVVDQMKPFFDQFAGLIGEGGEKFKNEVNPYAKQLGKFMNDIGLRIIDIVKNNGPALRNIFQGVLKLFGSIYDKVGGVVKLLLGIKDAGASSGGAFSAFSRSIDTIIDKINNIDIEVITEKIQGFIEGVKNIFSFIFDKIGAIGSFLKSNPGLGKSASMGALTIALAPNMIKDIGKSLVGKIFSRGNNRNRPLFVENTNGLGGGMASQMMGGGGRAAGIGGGFKKGWKGLFDYAKMSLKGGRAGKVGRARIARAAKGLVTGQGASFVGGTGQGAAQAAGNLGGVTSKLGSIGKGLGKLAKGGIIAAAVGMAAEAAFGHFAAKTTASADAMDSQIAAMGEGVEKEKSIEAQKEKMLKAQQLSNLGTIASYAATGAAIGSFIPIFGNAGGAIIGTVAGVVKAGLNHEKTSKYLDSNAFKASKARLRNQISIQKSEDELVLKGAQLRLEAIKKASEKETEIKLEFAEKLGASGNNAAEQLASLQNLDIEHTSEAFKTLATDALNAGNVTEEQFIKALKGTISPLDFINTAAVGAGEKLINLTSSALSAAEALGKEAEDKALADAGVDKNLINAQLDLLSTFNAQTARRSQDLLKTFGDDLLYYNNTTATELLNGTDEDSKAFRAQFVKSLKGTGVGIEAINEAMANAASNLEFGEDFDIGTTDGMNALFAAVTEQIQLGITDPLLQAQATGAAAKVNATSSIPQTTELISNITREQAFESEELQNILTGFGLDMSKVLENGIDDAEFSRIIDTLQTSTTTASIDDEKFNQIIDTLSSLNPPQVETEPSSIFEGAETVDDFILRPGQPVLKFNKDDLVMGGTDLGGNNENVSLSTEKLEQELQELKQIMSGFVEQMGQVVNRPISVELNGNKVGQALGQDSYRIQ